MSKKKRQQFRSRKRLWEVAKEKKTHDMEKRNGQVERRGLELLAKRSRKPFCAVMKNS